jgi:hypothetical protein
MLTARCPRRHRGGSRAAQVIQQFTGRGVVGAVAQQHRILGDGRVERRWHRPGPLGQLAPAQHLGARHEAEAGVAAGHELVGLADVLTGDQPGPRGFQQRQAL